MEVAVVTHQIAGDAPDARIRECSDKRDQRMVNISAMKTRADARVAPAIDDQIALNRAGVIRFCLCIKRRPDTVISAEPVPTSYFIRSLPLIVIRNG